MTTKTKIIIAAVASTVIAGGLGVAAFADDRGGKGRMGMMASVAIPVPNAAGIADCAFDALDRDGDGLINAPVRGDRGQRGERNQSFTQQDAQDRAATRFNQMDKNGDGVVDQADRDIMRTTMVECMTLMGMTEQAQKMEERMAQHNSDDVAGADDDEREGGRRGMRGQNGKPSGMFSGGGSGGRGGALSRGGRGGMNPIAKLLQADAETINGMDRTAFQGFVADKLSSMDANGDGTVSGGELIDTMRAAREG